MIEGPIKINQVNRPINVDDGLGADVHMLWQAIGRPWRRRFWGLMALSLVASASEVLSIGSLLPFLVVLTEPQALGHWPVVGQWLQSFALSSAKPTEFVMVLLGVVFGTMVLIASLVRWWLSAACSRYAYQVGGAIGQDIFKRVLLQPYSFHLTKTSSEIIDVTANRVQMVVGSVLMASLQLVTSLVMVLAIAGVLLWLNPLLASTALIGFGLVYLLIYRVSRQRLKANGERMSQVSAKRYQLLQEGVGGIRDIYIDGTQDYFVNAFQQADDAFRDAQSKNAVISASPRYFVEGLGTLLLASLAVVYATQTTSSAAGAAAFTSLVPMLGVLVLSAQRILPMMQQIYAGWTSIRGVTHTLHMVVQWLKLEVPNASPLKSIRGVESDSSNAVVFNNSLELIDVGFAYQVGMPNVLSHLDLKILKGQTVGLFGTTGAGKSTLLDVLMGLLQPTRGQLLIDGEAVGLDWRRQIAHVPQHVFLADSSITSNIAFGCPSEDVDHERVRQAIEQAQLSEFVEALPQSSQTVIGERGVRLSGGQRQRLGIARALYKRASLLVLDEATSALDPETEEAITESLARLNPDLTIVMVSHRPSALKYCDVVCRLEQGSLVQID
jgi:ATP-binding cassette subfamily B protein